MNSQETQDVERGYLDFIVLIKAERFKFHFIGNSFDLTKKIPRVQSFFDGLFAVTAGCNSTSERFILVVVARK